MDENVLSGRTLDKSISFGAIKPLNCTLLSHKLTPFASMSENSPLPEVRKREEVAALPRVGPTNEGAWARYFAAAPAAPVVS